MEKPKQSYRVWHSPRVGSSLLCQLLEDTGIAAKPGEHLSLHGHESLAIKYKVNSYEELRTHIWSMGSDQNGLFAAKVGKHHTYELQSITNICKMRNISIPEDHEEIWSDFFPNCKHILITRINKVQQAVSWWKAIQDGEWHLQKTEKRKTKEAFYDDKYVFDALKHLYLESGIRESYTQQFLMDHNYKFMTVAYEDLIQNTSREVNRILHYLGLIDQDIDIPKKCFQKTANEHNSVWVNRFRNDLQKSWDKKAW